MNERDDTYEPERKIQSGDLFKYNGESYECVGTENGFIWYCEDEYSESKKAEPMLCELTHVYLKNI